ncbi:MAG: zinc ribbon domain-containing protein [Deltaproteobacteria bacterium]|nr:zinc ribbon domain-containing protein [Deltaproteobacteria bacterium]
MPIYEYRCSHCENNFEELVLSSREAVACPACASRKVERQLSVFSSPGDRPGPAMARGGGCGGCTPGGCGCH